MRVPSDRWGAEGLVQDPHSWEGVQPGPRVGSLTLVRALPLPLPPFSSLLPQEVSCCRFKGPVPTVPSFKNEGVPAPQLLSGSPVLGVALTKRVVTLEESCGMSWNVVRRASGRCQRPGLDS